MGFLDGLKRGKVPSELPDLAVEGSSEKLRLEKKPYEETISSIPVVKPVEPPKKEVVEHDFLLVNVPEELKQKPVTLEKKEEPKAEKIDVGELSKESYFNKFLEDINGEIQDLGNLEEWYNKKFLPQDVVSNMRGFWEGNKSEIIIKSFGSDYKKKINEKISRLQELEMDWREIYFRLIKKEEEMKKEERELKETLSEFVDLCKQRGKNNEENKN